MSDETFATKDVIMTTVSLETRPVLAQAENVPKPKHDDSNLFDDTKTPQALHMIDLEQISRARNWYRPPDGGLYRPAVDTRRCENDLPEMPRLVPDCMGHTLPPHLDDERMSDLNPRQCVSQDVRKINEPIRDEHSLDAFKRISVITTASQQWSNSEPKDKYGDVEDDDKKKRKPYGGRPLKFGCTQCSRRFHAPSHLKRHMLCHSSERPFKCNLCGKGFLQAWHLGRHMTTHTGNKPFRCQDCPKSFGSRFELNTHYNYIHKGIKEHRCTICNKYFTLRSNLKVHMRQHTGEKPYSCTTCNKRFGQRGHLQYHLKKHARECTSESSSTLLSPKSSAPLSPYSNPPSNMSKDSGLGSDNCFSDSTHDDLSDGISSPISRRMSTDEDPEQTVQRMINLNSPTERERVPRDLYNIDQLLREKPTRDTMLPSDEVAIKTEQDQAASKVFEWLHPGKCGAKTPKMGRVYESYVCRPSFHARENVWNSYKSEAESALNRLSLQRSPEHPASMCSSVYKKRGSLLTELKSEFFPAKPEDTFASYCRHETADSPYRGSAYIRKQMMNLPSMSSFSPIKSEMGPPLSTQETCGSTKREQEYIPMKKDKGFTSILDILSRP